MAGVPIKQTLREKGVPSQLVGKALTKILKATMQDTGRIWHGDVLPAHFTATAAGDYNYRERSAAYRARKQRKGIREALVFTGNLRDRMVHTRKISGTKTKAKVRVPGAPHLHFNNKDQEIKRMRPVDDKHLAKEGQKAMQVNIDKFSEEAKVEVTEI